MIPGGKKIFARKKIFFLMAFEFGDSQFRDVSSSGIPDRYVDKKKGHFNRILFWMTLFFTFCPLESYRKINTRSFQVQHT